jgi:hypothetical protein
VYKLYNKEEMVENVHLPNEVHNYGFSKRAAAYRFLATHLGLDFSAVLNKKGVIDESFVEILPIFKMLVFPEMLSNILAWDVQVDRCTNLIFSAMAEMNELPRHFILTKGRLL